MKCPKPDSMVKLGERMCTPCRNARNPTGRHGTSQYRDVVCAGGCGSLVAGGAKAAPVSERMCKPCRQECNAGRRRQLCRGCGNPFLLPYPTSIQRFCSRSCHLDHLRAKQTESIEVRRGRRERLAPGLPRHVRNELLAGWMRKGRSCYYCIHPVMTVDHVIPLTRGGTHWEGNLVPACRSCNSSKWERTYMEWRLEAPRPFTTRNDIPERRRDYAVACRSVELGP